MPLYPDDEPMIGRDIPEFLDWMHARGDLTHMDDLMRFLEKPYYWATEYREFKKETRSGGPRPSHLF